MENLTLYNQVRTVPPAALKEIQAGRLKGKSDINPMWRIKMLTEQFGPCGIGWKYTITKQWLETGAKDEIAAFVNIDLYYKQNGGWSDAIPGTGGSAFVANERNGLYTSDECYKMALTDAISVACKALGFGADVYWDKDKTKYDQKPIQPTKPTTTAQNKPATTQPPQETPVRWPAFWAAWKKLGLTEADAHSIAGYESITHFTRAQANELMARGKIVAAERKAS